MSVTRTSVNLFDYNLPTDRIAQKPIEPRDHSKLMMLDRNTGAITHRKFFEIGQELQTGDVLVMNNTKVFRARLLATSRNKKVEIFLLRPEGGFWQVLARPGKVLWKGDKIECAGVEATIKEKRPDGIIVVDFGKTVEEVIAFANKVGHIPVPPYVEKEPEHLEDYQTIYAQKEGSVAAPTAGFHFTKQLIDDLKQKGIQIEYVTLHVGIGTFRPMKTENIEEHVMHAEYVEIQPETAQRINLAKAEGRRIIAVGTTTVRSLEGAADCAMTTTNPSLDGRGLGEGDFLSENGFRGDINIFITPGYQFKIINGLITNFHLPKSTLLVLVSALAGREHILAAYEEAIKKEYRFYSFGDAMFIQ